MEDLSSGVLQEPDRSDAGRHLSDCRTCRSAFQALRSGQWAVSQVGDPDQTIATQTGSTGSTSVATAASDASTFILGPDATVGTAAPAPSGWQNDATIATDPSTVGSLARTPRIDGYTITGVLGQGGMGIVYRAVQTKLNRTVALKVLPAMIGSASPSAVQRFRREATAAARLHHTNIIPIYDFGESTDAHYYAMELVVGEPLNDLIRRFAEKGFKNPTIAQFAQMMADVSMPQLFHSTAESVPGDVSIDATAGGSGGTRNRSYFRQVASWMADAADALHYAHSQDIIHRDIKPSNFILSNDGRIMLADFGLAKSAGEQSVTKTGALVGTLRYVSPEQAMAGRVKVDHRTDIYSLGATIYELLCFRPAYPGMDEKEILGAIISRDPPRPRKINPHVPAELDTICMKCMERSAEARYQSARALAEDLRRYISDLPIVAKRPNVAQRTVKFLRRHKAPAITVGTVMLLAVAVLFWTRESAARLRAEIRSRYDSAQAFVINNRWKEGEAELKLALQLDPENIESLLTLAWFKLEHYKAMPSQAGVSSQEEAVAACRKVLGVDPNNIKALGYMGIALRRLERYAEAIEPLERARKLDPTVYTTWSNLGTLYAVTGDLAKAEEYMLKGAQLAGVSENRWHASAWRNLAALELFLKKPEAVKHLKTAIECYSSDPWAWVLQARAHMELPDFVDLQKALDDAKYADRMGKMSDGKAKRVLALAYLVNGDPARAAQEARSALELGDEPSINHLIVAAAAKARSDINAAASSLAEAERTWPPPLRESGTFMARAGTGDLWIESADQRLELARQVRP